MLWDSNKQYKRTFYIDYFQYDFWVIPILIPLVLKSLVLPVESEGMTQFWAITRKWYTLKLRRYIHHQWWTPNPKWHLHWPPPVPTFIGTQSYPRMGGGNLFSKGRIAYIWKVTRAWGGVNLTTVGRYWIDQDNRRNFALTEKTRV